VDVLNRWFIYTFFIRIYPQLNTQNEDEHLEAVQDIVTVDFTSIDLNQKGKEDVPVIYTIA
jgi:hypothetical protein